MTTLKPRKPEESEVTLCQIIFPEQANPFGITHGGELLKIMDNAAGACAMKHAEGMVVTRSVNNVDFSHIVKIGDLVSVHAKIVYVSQHTMQILVSVQAEDLEERKTHHCASAYFVYATLDENKKILPVPALILSTTEEKTAFADGQERMAQIKKLNSTSS